MIKQIKDYKSYHIKVKILFKEIKVEKLTKNIIYKMKATKN